MEKNSSVEVSLAPPTPQKNVCIYSVGVCIEGEFALTGSLSSLINLTRRKKE